MIAGAGAEEFALEQGLTHGAEQLLPHGRTREAARARAAGREVWVQAPTALLLSEPFDDTRGTVGAVALDRNGNLAAATSTGGMTNKRPGRIGDSPIIGAGTYANNASCAVSATGDGEFFIRSVVRSRRLRARAVQARHARSCRARGDSREDRRPDTPPAASLRSTGLATSSWTSTATACSARHATRRDEGSRDLRGPIDRRMHSIAIHGGAGAVPADLLREGSRQRATRQASLKCSTRASRFWNAAARAWMR